MYRRLFPAFVLMLIAAVPVWGQDTSAGIRGTVRSGSTLLESVSIQFTDMDHGSTFGTVTNRYGVYVLSGMRPGKYEAVFSYVGYQTVRQTDIVISIGTELSLDIDMKEAGTTLDDIDITAEYTHFMETRTGQTYSIRNERLELLPSVNRSLLDYTRLSAYSGLDNSMAGRDGRTTTLTIDGAALSNSFGLSPALPGGGSPVSVDAIDEVQVVIAPYDVRQSGFTGGGINAVTKSGTNDFKASAYTLFRNENLRGNSVDGNSLGSRETEAKTILGFTAGGPIIRNRLFFFVNGEFERRPEPISQWSLSKDGIGDGAAMLSRVTRNDMDRFSKALAEYGYDAGSTDLSDGGLTGLRLLGRIDWYISERHNLMLRYNYTDSKQWYSPNNNSGVGVKPVSDRISKNAYAFRNNCYRIDDVAWSAVAELNSRYGKADNRLLLTTSYVGNNRYSDSDVFPHVDIWKDGDAFMSAGYELFSLGTGNDLYSYSISDHLRWTLGHSVMTAGISYELQKASTTYMQFAPGYYRYASLEDFEQRKAPAAFGYTYGYNGVGDPASKSSIGQGAMFIQSETRLTPHFRLTYGLRADLISFHQKLYTNKSYYKLDWTKHYFPRYQNVPAGWQSPHIDTGRWPDASVQLSPRVGFNWDVAGNGSIILHGGAGLFAGRIPMVFFTNLPNYSNMMQNTVMVSSNTDGFLSGLAGNFLYRQEDIRKYLYSRGYPMTVSSNPPVKSASLCGISSDFKMPQVLKASLSADWTLPLDFPMTLSVEGIYNKDLNAVCVRNLNLLNNGDFMRFTGADDRLNYRWQDVYGTKSESPLLYEDVTGGAMLLTNTHFGYSYSLAATVTMEPVRNLKFELSYIHQNAMSVSDMTGSSLYSTWKNVVSVNDPNEEVLRPSGYVVPNRVMAAVTYEISHGRNMSTALGIFYNGSNMGRYSYMCMNDMNGDGVVNDLIYIPAARDEILFVDNGKYTAEMQQDAFWNFVCSDSYLSRHKGSYAQANRALIPWLNRIDLRLAENIRIGNTPNRLQLSVDIMNVGNLICDRWGVQQTPSACNNGRILNYQGTDKSGNPLFTLYAGPDGLLKKACEPLQNTSNCWYLQFSVRYTFN